MTTHWPPFAKTTQFGPKFARTDAIMWRIPNVAEPYMAVCNDRAGMRKRELIGFAGDVKYSRAARPRMRPTKRSDTLQQDGWQDTDGVTCRVEAQPWQLMKMVERFIFGSDVEQGVE